MAETPRGDARGGDPRDAGPGNAGRMREGGEPTSPGSRSSQARARHDNGQYRDKIPVKDPAASPLGTDSEASGFSTGEGSMEPAPAGGFAPADSHPAGHARGGEARTNGISGMSIAIALVVLAVAVALIAVVF